MARGTYTIKSNGTVKGKCPGCGNNVTGMTVNQFNRHMARCTGASDK